MLPPAMREYPIAGLFSVGTAVAAVVTAGCFVAADTAMAMRFGALTLVLSLFASLFWLEPFAEEYA